MRNELKQVLMERDGMTGIEADLEIKGIRSRVSIILMNLKTNTI